MIPLSGLYASKRDGSIMDERLGDATEACTYTEVLLEDVIVRFAIEQSLYRGRACHFPWGKDIGLPYIVGVTMCAPPQDYRFC